MNKNSKFGKFLAGKGFYAVLALCLVGAGAASWIAVDKTLSGLEKAPGGASSFFQNSSNTADVGKEQSSVPKPDSSSSHLPPPSSSAASDSSKPNAQQTALPTSPTQYFMLPVSGEIQVEYSNRELVKSQTMGDWRTHNGVDIACAVNTAVKCFSDGTVAAIEDDELWGKVVHIEHDNGYKSVYCGLNENISVKVGESVEIGKVIGTTGQGSLVEIAQEPHLHFEVTKDGTTVDPIKLIKNQ